MFNSFLFPKTVPFMR